MANWYILDDKNNPVLSTMEGYGIWKENNPRLISVLNSNFGEVRISTVFLELDHAFSDDLNDPILWETIIF